MTALTAPRQVSEKAGVTSTAPVAADTKIWQGALVVMAAGVAKPGHTAATLVVLGVAEETVDNTGGAGGAKSVTARRGTFRFVNLGADALTTADVGKDAYLVDDQTVAKTSATDARSVAGKVIDVDAAGAWIRVGY